MLSGRGHRVAIRATPEAGMGHMTVEDRAPPADTAIPEEVTFSMSADMMSRLARLDIGIAFTSYQSGYLYMLGSSPEHGAQLHQSVVAKPMGLCAFGDELLLSAGGAVVRYADILEPHEQVNHIFDACYVPRSQHLIGDLDAHDIGIDADGRIVFVNTRYNCLATLSPRHSFEPVWRPPFISAMVAEDRCHLNGLAMDRGRPAYVTAVSRSDTIDGWRDRRADGGVVIDVASGEIVAHGLSMPHSPRVHEGTLWILNSGTGEIGTIGGDGRFAPRAFCPGFTRGLAFHDRFAFVGLSKPRYKRFEGLALDARLRAADSEPWCGIQVIDLETGACVDWFRIDGAVAELYDLAVIAGRRCPMALSPGSAEATALVTVAAGSAASAIEPTPLSQLAR
jgi:uncharacterized protein (TIGR03032 family)